MKKISNLWLRLFAISVVMVSWSSLCIADTFIVTHTYNTGSGSLRWAIEQTNNNPGPDTIRFNIPADDEGFKDNVWTIKPLNNLPTITDDSTVIDGCTQTINQGDKNSDGPEIVLDGRENEMNGYGLEIQSSGNEVSGLVISGFSGEGIRIQRSEAHDNRIRGNYIGTNASGSDTLGNDDGIIIYNHSAHNIIGGKGENEGNVISGNHDNGIFISSSDSNVVIGNRIGTDATGMLSLGNGQNGIYIGYYCTGNIIGGSKTGERNVLSGNGYDGIYVYGRQIRGNIIQGNFIGVDINGTSALGNYLGIALGWEVSKTVVGGLAWCTTPRLLPMFRDTLHGLVRRMVLMSRPQRRTKMGIPPNFPSRKRFGQVCRIWL